MPGLLGWLSGEQRDPEVVLWSPDVRGHSSDETGKTLIHGDIIISVSAPSFQHEGASVYVVVSNLGKKALGFGSSGFGLVLTTGSEKKTIMATYLVEKQRGTRRVDIYNERQSQNLMVESGEGGFDRGVHFVAEFPPAAQPEQADLVIQANRILAASIVFHFPSLLSVNPSGPRPDESSRKDPVQVVCQQCGANLQQGSRFCHHCGTSQEPRSDYANELIERYRAFATKMDKTELRSTFSGEMKAVRAGDMDIKTKLKVLVAYAQAEEVLFGKD